MKRTIGIVVALTAVAAVVYVGSNLSAQQPAGGGVKPASSTTPAAGSKARVAVFNLKFVVTQYWKWSTLQKQYEDEMKGFEGRIMPLKTKFEALGNEIKGNPKMDPATKDAKEKEMRNLQRQLQDIDEEAKAKLVKKQSDMMVTLYNEVAGTVSRYAAAHDIELVMHYNDGVNATEMNQPENIYRKINTGACTPVFWKAGVDISSDLVATLNASAPAGWTPPPATPAAGTGTGTGTQPTTNPTPPKQP